MSKAPKTVLDLVELFGQNIETYRSPAYNETMLRQEFINPFFEALGWDIYNKAGTLRLSRMSLFMEYDMFLHRGNT